VISATNRSTRFSHNALLGLSESLKRYKYATGPCEARAHDPVYTKAARNVFQFLGHIFTQPAQLAATLGAFRATGCQLDLVAGNMVRDRFALRLVGG